MTFHYWAWIGDYRKKDLERRLGNIILLQIPRARTGLLDIYQVPSECGYFGIVTPLI